MSCKNCKECQCAKENTEVDSPQSGNIGWNEEIAGGAAIIDSSILKGVKFVKVRKPWHKDEDKKKKKR